MSNYISPFFWPTAYGVGQRSVLRSKTAAERSERPPVYYKKVVILL